MKPFYTMAAASLGVACLGAHAQDIYKWTDANGHVHYGDRAAAPGSSTQLRVEAAPSVPRPAAVPADAAVRRRTPAPGAQGAAEPVDPALVGTACKGLIDKIAAVRAGTNWEALYRQFDSACPGVAYDCVEYKSAPQNNRCTWVKRSNGRVLNTSRYP